MCTFSAIIAIGIYLDVLTYTLNLITMTQLESFWTPFLSNS